MVSSAYSLILSGVFFATLIPLILLDLRMLSARGSIAMAYRRGLSGQPCRTPLCNVTGSVVCPFTMTDAFACW